MKKLMKWILIAAGCIAVLVLLLFVIGALLPAGHTFSRKFRLKQTPDAVFSLLADVARLPEWSRNVQTVEVLPPVEGREVTRQTFQRGMVMTVTTAESVRPGRLVRTISDAKGPFSGSWSYGFIPVEGGCQIVLTEHGEIRNPVFRVLGRVFGLTKYADEHLQDIAAKFGETAVID